jgi:hypothetical protein
MTGTIENKIKEQDQEMAGINNLNEDYKSHPKKEYPYLNFIEFEKYGVVIENE